MTQDEIVAFVAGLPGVAVLVASEAGGAPEVAWGDTFCYYDPDAVGLADRELPFATVVINDYPGFDTASQLDRPGVFRVNIAVGRRAFEELFGYPPAAHTEHQASWDYSAIDTVIPHPVYAVQGWASVLNPGEQTAALTRTLLTNAHSRAMARHRPR